MTPLVSIIIPTYNRAYLIAETLESICSQTYTKWECIIVDDHSTDTTELVVNHFVDRDSRFSFHKRPETKRKGANACRNFGLELASGQFVTWCDSDDIMVPEHLAVHMHQHSHSHCDAIVTSAEVFQGNTQNIVRKWDSICPKYDIVTEMIYNQVLWPINCVTWDRNSIPAKPFREKLASSQEWTFHLSRLLDDITYKIIEKPTCLVREHQQRTGKIVSVSKSFSTFHSRKIIMELLTEKQMRTPKNEKGLLKYIFTALRQALQYRYYKLAFVILGYLVQSFGQTKYRREIAKIILIASPIYALSGRGEKLFKI